MKSSFQSDFHVAIVMDGNGRWAERRGLERWEGHRRGSRSVRRVVEAAPGLGIGVLTLYAFSSDNFSRPWREVSFLMDLLRRYLVRERRRCRENGVRINVVGRRDRLSAELRTAVEEAEALTVDCRRLHLRLAVDYSARQLIAAAALRCRGFGGDFGPPDFGKRLNEVMHSQPAAPDVDLLVRAGGELRLSDFLLWECAYAEFFFTDRLWPDFGADDLARAVREFKRRTRRFGRVLQAAG